MIITGRPVVTMPLDEWDVQRTYEVFYRIPRAGQVRLSDGGGPFGFDVHLALLVHELVVLFDCDAICETGAFLGDTTLYLACRYPHLPVYTCDTDQQHVTITRRRLAGHAHVSVWCCDSPELVAGVAERHDRPLFFLDAHWAEPWPLEHELEILLTGGGVAVIHDFDIGHPRFSFDSYQGRDCGPALLAGLPDPPAVYYTPRPQADWPLPCLQTGRRAGTAIVTAGLDDSPLRHHPLMTARTLTPGSGEGR